MRYQKRKNDIYINRVADSSFYAKDSTIEYTPGHAPLKLRGLQLHPADREGVALGRADPGLEHARGWPQDLAGNTCSGLWRRVGFGGSDDAHGVRRRGAAEGDGAHRACSGAEAKKARHWTR